MKNNIVKYLLAFSVVFFFTACEETTNDIGNENPSSGWVEFDSAATTIAVPLTSATIPLDIQVPIYQNGLNISYTLEPVEGDYTQFVTNASSGSVYVDPTDYTRTAGIDLNLQNLDVDRDFNTVFKITITAVDAADVGIGVDGTSNTEHLVTFPPYVAPLVPNEFFLGDYTIVDVAATIGPGNGTENFAGGTVTLSIDTSDQNRRLFSVGALPAFNPEVEDVSIEFTATEVGLGGDVDPSLSCNGGVSAYIFTPLTSGNTAWDINTADDNFVFIQYTEDPNGSCGGPFVSSFSLTKN